HGLYSSPDRHCSPGALNPAVKQSTIDQTICVSGYTKTIRPPESVTNREKLASMAAYGDTGRSPHDFEYDHIVSLELGGGGNPPRNRGAGPGRAPDPEGGGRGPPPPRGGRGAVPAPKAAPHPPPGRDHLPKTAGGPPAAGNPPPTRHETGAPAGLVRRTEQ